MPIIKYLEQLLMRHCGLDPQSIAALAGHKTHLLAIASDGLRIKSAMTLLVVALLFSGAVYADNDEQDPRAYNHGIEAVEDGVGGYRVFFSSSGLVPTGSDDNGNWSHDIYMGAWRAGQVKLNPKPFLAKPEAQEPVSVTRSTDGHVMVTNEDGWDTYGEVEQRYSVYDASLKSIKKYPNTVSDGGHSGHTAAIGNRFVIFYSDEWIKGGGVDNLGTGGGVYAKIYDSNGRELKFVPIAAHKREWWPLIAASPRKALLVWQAFVDGETYATLKFAVMDAAGNVTAPKILDDGLRYYTYAVKYIPGVDRFFVTGTTRKGRAFAYLIDEEGQITAKVDCMPPIMRESGVAVLGNDVFVPVEGDRLFRLSATPTELSVTGIMNAPLAWSVVGSVGLPNGIDKLHYFSLARTGLQEADFDVRVMQPPAPQDLCQ